MDERDTTAPPANLVEAAAFLNSTSEAFNFVKTLLSEHTFVGQDIIGYPERTLIPSGESTTINLTISHAYFEGLDLSHEQKQRLIYFLLSFGLYSDRSVIAQSGGRSEFRSGVGNPLTVPNIDELIRMSDKGFEIELKMQNLNPVRDLQFPLGGFAYMRLYVLGKGVVPKGELTRYAYKGEEEVEKNLIALPIARFATYQPGDDPIYMETLSASDRADLDRKIGLVWQDSPPKVDGDNPQMIIGETIPITIPVGYVGRIDRGAVPITNQHGKNHYASHQSSVMIDEGYTGPVRTEYQVLGPGKDLPTHLYVHLHRR